MEYTYDLLATIIPSFHRIPVCVSAHVIVHWPMEYIGGNSAFFEVVDRIYGSVVNVWFIAYYSTHLSSHYLEYSIIYQHTFQPLPHITQVRIVSSHVHHTYCGLGMV